VSMPRLRSVREIVESRLCLGCGACAYVCPGGAIRLVDVVDEGVRPVLDDRLCACSAECLQVCPGIQNDHREINRRRGILRDIVEYCGPVLEIWEGHATDGEIRFAGSSGGVITALSLYCLEREAMHGVVHIGMDERDPTRSRTKLSRTRAELLANTGSRYAPTSACDSLGDIERAPGKCVFIGQPSEVTALRKAERLRPALQDRVGVAISFFCAGAPSREGTLALLRSMGVDPVQVESVRYRGHGWPGMFTAKMRGETRPAARITYKESWSFVQAFRPFSTELYPDGTGEDADIACGDPWYREIASEEPGSSLVVVRTERGRRILREAMRAGYVSLTPAEEWKLLESQRNLIAKRGVIGGRIAVLKVLGYPVPELRGFSLLRNWWRLEVREKIRSILGTVRRAIKGDLDRRGRRTGPVRVMVRGLSMSAHRETFKP
jgi:coenzyme F420 hydrogenase subunit beta